MSFCIVTGSSSGNGFAIAKFLKNNNHIVIGVDLESTHNSNTSQFVQGNITEPKVIEKVFKIFLESNQDELYLINNE